MTSTKLIAAAFMAALLAAIAIPNRISAQQPAGPQGAPPTPQDTPQAPASLPPSSSGNQKTPEYSISVTSNLVNVDVVVTDQDGNIVTGLTKENFRIFDDSQPQIITNFTPSEAPLTVVMLMEYSARFWNYYAAKGVYWGQNFLSQLNKDDWVALVTYAMRTTVQLDFTQNKNEVQQAMYSLGFPDFHEANMFDALLETTDRMKDVKGKRAIVLITTGADTFSKHTLDQTYKVLRGSDVPIFSVGLAEVEEETADALGQISAAANIGYLQSKNELDTFAKMTGGYAWFPRFDGEIPGIFQTVAQFLRHQYTIGFSPSNPAHDGKYHKLKIEVVDADGNPYTMPNKKGKHQKVVVYAREGYVAPESPIGD